MGARQSAQAVTSAQEDRAKGARHFSYNANMVRLETVLESWKTVRQDTAQAVEDFPANEFDYRPTPDLMTFAELGRHILEAGHALTGLLLAGEMDLSGGRMRELMKNHKSPLPENADAPALVRELRSQLEARCNVLAAKPPDFYSTIITRFDGVQVTRLEMLQFIKEHELTHRSQIFMYLRLKGIVPPTTRRRLAQQAGKK